jgi:hypothetical protein
MPFDPNQPQANELIDAVQLRNQFNSLNDEIAVRTTSADLATAIADTARNPLSITPLAITFSDPPTPAEAQAIVDAFNALVTALQR